MTEISHVTGKDNVVPDVLSRYPEMTVQNYDHLLSEEHEMDLLCVTLFNITTDGGDATLDVDDFGSTTQDLSHTDALTPSPVTYSEEVVGNLIYSPPSKICVDDYAVTSFVTVDLEVGSYSDTYPTYSGFQ